VRQQPQRGAAALGFADQLIGDIGVQGDAVDRRGLAEPGVEWRREAVLDAFRGDADDDRPVAHQRRGNVAVHDLADAFLRERVGTTVIVE